MMFSQSVQSSLPQHSVLDSVDLKVDPQGLEEMLVLDAEDAMYPDRAADKGGKRGKKTRYPGGGDELGGLKGP